MPTTTTEPDPTLRFETHDLALAAFLRCRQYPLLDVRREQGGRCVFVFTDRPARPSDVAAFFDESGLVPALKYAEATRLLKARIYQR
jgi:Domain of unknown function (DUF5659)